MGRSGHLKNREIGPIATPRSYRYFDRRHNDRRLPWISSPIGAYSQSEEEEVQEGFSDFGAPRARSRSFSDARARFRRHAAEAVEGGLVRHTQRRRLLEHARSLGLSAFEASLVIAEVQYGRASATVSSENPAPVARRILACRSWRRVSLLWGSALLLLAALILIMRSHG